LAAPGPLTTLCEKPIKIGAKVARPGRDVTFRKAGVEGNLPLPKPVKRAILASKPPGHLANVG